MFDAIKGIAKIFKERVKRRTADFPTKVFVHQALRCLIFIIVTVELV